MATKQPTGRPRVPIDWEKVAGLLKMQCSTAEIAAQVGVHPDTLYNRCLEDLGEPYTDYSVRMRENGKASLRASMFKEAVGGNVTLQIWLSKQYLGMSDKQAVKHSGDANNPLNIIINEVAYGASRTARPGSDSRTDGQTD